MSDFDPYLKWLGIRDPQRPPNHYRLLGLDLFEPDPEVISGAADRQMTHVRTFQLGPHGEESQTILGELAEARRCLLDAQQKQKYDLELTQQIDQASMLPPAPPVIPQAMPAAATIPNATTVQPQQPVTTTGDVAPAGGIQMNPAIAKGKPRKDRSKQKAFAMLIGWVLGGVAALAAGYWILNSDLFGRNAAVVDQQPVDNNQNSVDPGRQNNDSTNDQNSNGQNNNQISSNRPNQPERTPPAAPWDDPKRPPPPEHWLTPKTKFDQVMQTARLAVGRRDYPLARNEWERVKQIAKAENPRSSFGTWLQDLHNFWNKVTDKARELKPGEQLEYRGQTVEVVSSGVDQLKLKTLDGRHEKVFAIRRQEMDRDLATGLATLDEAYSPDQIAKILSGDFLGHPQLDAALASVQTGTVSEPSAPPDNWLSPKTELDRLLQKTRWSIGQREYSTALEEWNRVRHRVQQINPELQFGTWVDDIQEFWETSIQRARDLAVGSELVVAGRTAKVQSRSREQVTLRFEDDSATSFALDEKSFDRDLAISLVKQNGDYNDREIARLLAGDFIHIDFSNLKTTVAAAAPWDNPDWPDPPESILKPTTELDRLLQPTRIAIAQRKFREAQAEWAKVALQAKSIDPSIDLNRELQDMFRILALASRAARQLSIGDRFDFRGKPVEVVGRNSRTIKLGDDNLTTRTFDLRPDTMDRDLALSLALQSKQADPDDISKSMAVDFLHFNFNDLNRSLAANNTDPDSSETMNPSLDNGVVDVENLDNNSASMETTVRQPVPAEAEQDDVRDDIRSLYSEAFDKNKSYVQKMTSVRSMVDGAVSTRDPAMKFVMLSESHDIACDLGDANVAMETLQLIGKMFEIDFWVEAREMVNDLNKKAKSFVQVNDFYKNLVDLTYQAIAEKQYKDAVTFSGKAAAAARKLEDDESYDLTVKLRNDVREMERFFDRAEKARLKLTQDPDDKSANLDLGDYLCLVEGNIDEGLKHWAKSDNPRLQHLAQLATALSEDSTATEHMSVADAWYYLGKNLKTFKDRQFVMRSRDSYQKVLETAKGAEKKKAESRLKESEGLLTKVGQTTDEFFKRTWLFDVDNQQFEAIFFKSGKVQFKVGNVTDAFSWQQNGREIVVPYPVDSSIFRFIPGSDGDTITFRKTRARDGRLLKRGSGRRVD